jgi:hypothetical protein
MPIAPTLSGAAKEYIAALRTAANAYFRDQGDYGREGTIRALMATVRFIEEASLRLPRSDQVEMERLKEPFFVLASALNDLKTGAVNPLIRPAEVHNRRVLPSSVRIGRANAAAALELLIMAGASRIDAAKHVASKLKGSVLFEGGRRSDWKAVVSWRDEIRASDYRVALDDWKHHPHARSDVVVFDHYVGEARRLFDRGEWDANGLKKFADFIVIDGGWSHGEKKGRPNLE